jgi:hypothetical protein
MAGYAVTFTVVDNATKQIDAINRRVAQMRAPMERMSRSISRFVDVSGLRKVATGFEWIAKSVGAVFRSLSAVVPLMGAITGAASIAGMVKLVSSYAAWSRELVQTADNIGITTQQLQQFEDATRLAGGNASDMDQSLKSLHDNLADLNIGRGSFAETAQMLNRLGVNARDATGHLRSAGDLMPELIAKIAALKDPADRARIATGLLGAEGDKLVETFRQSSQSFAQWFSDASRYKELTDEQKKSLQQFSEAQGRVGVAFDHLGQQISIMIAQHFGPLLQRFAIFVEKHTPDILHALDQLSTRFAAWLESIKWEDVEAGITKFIDSLKWVWKHLDDIKLAAEVIATLFVVKWGVGIVRAIGGVDTALGVAGVGAAGGSGLLGSLGRTLALANATVLAFQTMQKAYDPATYAPENLPAGSPFWQGIPEDEQRKYPNSPVNQKGGGGPSFLQNPPGWLKNRLFNSGGPTAPLDLPPGTPGQPAPELAALPGDTSWGHYGARANNPGDLEYANWEGAGGRFKYTDPHVGTAHTMAVFKTMEEGVSAAYKLMEAKQKKYGATLAGAVHGWAETPGYTDMLAKQVGVDPNAPFDVAKADPQTVQRLLQAQFKLEGSTAGSHGVTGEQILGGINLARGVTPPVPGAPAVNVAQSTPPNGAVDVSITHKNAPPNSSVTATGSGSVNVAPVRVEHQDMASI